MSEEQLPEEEKEKKVEREFSKKALMAFFPGNIAKLKTDDSEYEVKIKLLDRHNIIVIGEIPDLKSDDRISLVSEFEGAIYMIDGNVKRIDDNGDIHIIPDGKIRIKTRRKLDRYYTAIPVIINDEYRGVIWDLNNEYIAVLVFREDYLKIMRDKKVIIFLSKLNAEIHGEIFKVTIELFELIRVIIKVESVIDKEGKLKSYFIKSVKKWIYENKELSVQT